MYISQQDLNPRIAKAFDEQILVLSEKRARQQDLSEPERHACAVLERQQEADTQLPPFSGTTVPLLMSVLIVGTYAGFYFDYTVSAFGAPLTFASLLCFVGWLSRKTEIVGPLRCSPEVLRAVFPLILRTRAEDIYYESLLLLSDRETPLDEPTRRDILRHLNTLLENRYQLDTNRRRILTLKDSHALAGLEAERDELEQKRERTDDVVTQEALRQSVALCQARLESARALGPMLTRLDAQQEIIHQALASIHFALARLQVAPATLAMPDITEIHQTVARINNQTRAMEEAVAEVMALRA
jgi:hypothetical protein